MILGMTKDVQCDIISDTDYGKDTRHKKIIFIFIIGFIITSFCVGDIVDDYRKKHSTFAYSQQTENFEVKQNLNFQ